MTTTSALRLLVASAALCAGGVATAQVSGAIHTTTPDGSIVNENTHYTSKDQVYLSGGPGPNAPPEAAGLPPGEYYFMVTDPSGKQLLSTDSARNRCVVVGSQGFIVDQNCGATFGPGNHPRNPKAGSPVNEFVVKLMPYDDTPNNGGVYKAWMTPVGKYVGDINALGNQNCGNGCFHGFMPGDSKTDNFKVRDVVTYCITAWKFIQDKLLGTVATSGWPIVFEGNILHTGPQGFVRICNLVPGQYVVAEELNADFELVATEVNGDSLSPPQMSVNVTVGRGNRAEREPIIVWTNKSKSDSGCTKNCYYK